MRGLRSDCVSYFIRIGFRKGLGSVNTKVTIAGVELKNPITVASGTFGFGIEMSEYTDVNELGAIFAKAVTVDSTLGNRPPRIAETPLGILNSVGLQNPGVDVFLKYTLPQMRKFDTRIIANIAGKSEEEYCEVVSRLGKSVDMLELNISCPNVREGGAAFGTDAKTAERVTAKVKAAAQVPLVVKLSPNVTDIAEIARAVESAGADAVSLINTILGMKINPRSRKPILGTNVGGLSGPAIMPIAVRMVWQVAKAVKIPIIGMGGIMSGEDAVEFMLAGATAVSIGTATLVNPNAAVEIKRQLVEFMQEQNIKDVNDIIGGVILN